jgi:hypothetical protein
VFMNFKQGLVSPLFRTIIVSYMQFNSVLYFSMLYQQPNVYIQIQIQYRNNNSVQFFTFNVVT